ncbi:MAG: ATP-dependent DNA helicase RecG [Bacteroidales bacterium]|jgi:ATP-dependent DNA helicase RecG|nr:ATP-dependent DNA helicase RecG [Bacteroidales bacterium]
MDLQYVPGIGPKRAALLASELKVTTDEELLNYFPYRYVDKSKVYRICDLQGEMPYVLLRGRFTMFEELGVGTRGHRYRGVFSDGTGMIECLWFQGIRFIKESVLAHEEYMLFGAPKLNDYTHGFQVSHPELEPASKNGVDAMQSLMGMYNTTEKMKKFFLNSRAIQRIILGYLQKHIEPFPETLPAYIVEHLHLMKYNQAIRQIHFPANPDNLQRAQYRLKFEELFYLQLYLIRSFKMRQQANRGFVFGRVGEVFNEFYFKHLPFELTNAQKRVIKEIRADMGSGRQMNRLLQGDVGSGKTMVALLTMLIAIDNGFQACLMAPTEILATQHYESLSAQLAEMNVRVALLTGSTRKKQRDEIHAGLLDGSVQILIGTHALIEPDVRFRNLGMVVIDEQHRFGVEQRSKLWVKNVQPPHVLVMTATPIPRTLAMTMYGDLDVSVIDELPPGRKPIQTIHRWDQQREGLIAAMRKQLEQGRQIYVVYPLIEENEKLKYRDVEQGFENMQAAFGPEYRVVMVHGKMKPKDKEAAMQRFVSGEAHIMVATTVIEVGVNVPNASVMVIESAERFGLSQLHQLRGRVGRGADQSYCVLVTGYELSHDTRKRIQIMCDTTDGFEIAEADLQLRGPGDMEGTQQSGMAFELHIASLAKDGQILQFARDLAKEIIDKDPLLEASENGILRRRLDVLFAHKVDWSQIS